MYDQKTQGPSLLDIYSREAARLDAVQKDWDRQEALAEALSEAEKREALLEEARGCNPDLQLHRLPMNFWVARITEPPAELHKYHFPECPFAGAYSVQRLDPHTLFFRSELAQEELLENISLLFLPF